MRYASAAGCWLLAMMAALPAMGAAAAAAAAAGAADANGGPARADSRARYVHRLPLSDGSGTATATIKPTDANGRPYSVSATCVTCHDVSTISHGWHFNATDPAVPAGRNGEPWIYVDAQTRTQVPLSYRSWAGTFAPAEFGLTPFAFTAEFGRHQPGGGAGVLTDVKDPKAIWRYSGALEVDCMICHAGEGSNYDPSERAKALKGLNFKYAPTIGMGIGSLGHSIKKAADLKEEEEEDGGPKPGKAAPLHKMHVDKGRFDADGGVFFDVVREPPASRCYYCHSQHAVGAGPTGSKPLWQREGDVHMAQGMTCAQCHRAGIEHVDTRGYEGEAADRKVPELASLTCAGCHDGTKLGAPRPLHKGIPPVHFELLACTACHSGPLPGAQAELVQTSMAHALGIQAPREATTLPQIAAPVFLKGHDGKIAPHRMVWPNFWGWQGTDGKVTPIPPEAVKKAAGAKLPPAANPTAAATPLTEQQVTDVLTALAAGGFQTFEAPPSATRPATTRPAVAGQGAPVYISGGKLLKLAGGKLSGEEHEEAKPYSWPIGHDVRPAGQSLGATSCTECHSTQGAIYFARVAAVGPVDPNVAVVKTNLEHRGGSALLHNVWALGFVGRPFLKILMFACAAVLAAVLLHYGLKNLGAVLARRR